MNYLYIDLPKNTNGKINFHILEKGDSLEVRLNELTESKTEDIFKGIEKLRFTTELSFKKTNDAYGSIQIFKFR